MPAAPTPAVLAEALAAAAARYGTPAYVYDLARIRARIRQLEQALPAGVEIRYSVKANPAPAVCAVIADAGLAAEVSSAGELTTAVDAGFPPAQIMVSGPYKDPDLLHQISTLPEALISVDSISELAQLAAQTGTARQAVLRLRPDYPPSGDMCEGLPRFGIPVEHLDTCLAYLHQNVGCVGFHIYGGSQILDGARAAQQLRDAADLAIRAARLLDVHPDVLNVGGGFGVPHADGDELDLAPAARTLLTVGARMPGTRLVLELGRYLVADAGWYLTRVVQHQTVGDGPAVVVDGGIHQRPDLCGLDIARRARPPLLLGPPRGGVRTPTAVLGCLRLPADILAYAAALPALSIGDVLAFPTAGAYGLTAAPTGFLGHRLPAEVALDDGILTVLPPPPLWAVRRPQPAGVP